MFANCCNFQLVIKNVVLTWFRSQCRRWPEAAGRAHSSTVRRMATDYGRAEGWRGGSMCAGRRQTLDWSLRTSDWAGAVGGAPTTRQQRSHCQWGPALPVWVLHPCGPRGIPLSSPPRRHPGGGRGRLHHGLQSWGRTRKTCERFRLPCSPSGRPPYKRHGYGLIVHGASQGD